MASKEHWQERLLPGSHRFYFFEFLKGLGPVIIQGMGAKESRSGSEDKTQSVNNMLTSGTLNGDTSSVGAR